MLKQRKFLIMGVVLAVTVVGSYLAIRMLLPNASEANAPEVKQERVGEFYIIDGIMVNPAGTKGARFLRVSAALESMNDDILVELETRDVQIRDILITELSANTIGQLMDPVTKEEIRQRIIEKINRLLQSGSLNNLYYLDYIVQ